VVYRPASQRVQEGAAVCVCVCVCVFVLIKKRVVVKPKEEAKVFKKKESLKNLVFKN
jgi:hypothetical protein